MTSFFGESVASGLGDAAVVGFARRELDGKLAAGSRRRQSTVVGPPPHAIDRYSQQVGGLSDTKIWHSTDFCSKSLMSANLRFVAGPGVGDHAAMTRAMTTFKTADLSPTDGYKLTTGLIVPRPIGWIGTYGPDRTANLAPYSFFQAVATNPPVVLFSTGVSATSAKDSLTNARATGVFTANLVDHDLSVAMNETAATVGPEISEFGLAGLTAKEFGSIDAPGVAEAKAVLECRLIDEKTFGDDPDLHHTVAFGEVVAFHVADEVLDGTRIDAAKLDALGRLAGSGYTTTRDQFRLERP